MGDVFLKGTAHMNPHYIQDKVLPELEVMHDIKIDVDESAKVSWREWIARKLISIVKRIEKFFGK